MIRTTIYLPNDIHSGLKHLALERSRSMAQLLREAIEKLYHEDLKDLRTAREAWKKHAKNLRGVQTARDYFTQRAKHA